MAFGIKSILKKETVFVILSFLLFSVQQFVLTPPSNFADKYYEGLNSFRVIHLVISVILVLVCAGYLIFKYIITKSKDKENKKNISSPDIFILAILMLTIYYIVFFTIQKSTCSPSWVCEKTPGQKVKNVLDSNSRGFADAVGSFISAPLSTIPLISEVGQITVQQLNDTVHALDCAMVRQVNEHLTEINNDPSRSNNEVLTTINQRSARAMEKCSDIYGEEEKDDDEQEGFTSNIFVPPNEGEGTGASFDFSGLTDTQQEALATCQTDNEPCNTLLNSAPPAFWDAYESQGNNEPVACNSIPNSSDYISNQDFMNLYNSVTGINPPCQVTGTGTGGGTSVAECNPINPEDTELCSAVTDLSTATECESVMTSDDPPTVACAYTAAETGSGVTAAPTCDQYTDEVDCNGDEAVDGGCIFYNSECLSAQEALAQYCQDNDATNSDICDQIINEHNLIVNTISELNLLIIIYELTTAPYNLDEKAVADTIFAEVPEWNTISASFGTGENSYIVDLAGWLDDKPAEFITPLITIALELQASMLKDPSEFDECDPLEPGYNAVDCIESLYPTDYNSYKWDEACKLRFEEDVIGKILPLNSDGTARDTTAYNSIPRNLRFDTLVRSRDLNTKKSVLQNDICTGEMCEDSTECRLSSSRARNSAYAFGDLMEQIRDQGDFGEVDDTSSLQFSAFNQFIAE